MKNRTLAGSFIGIVAMVAALLLGGATAQAATGTGTGPDGAGCSQHALMVVCELDWNIFILNDPDVVVEIEKALSGDEFEILNNALKDAEILNDLTIDVDLIEAVVADVLDVGTDQIITIPCAIQAHTYC
ncbi:MAG TPA: hypothetical protein VGX25_02525 [Actinophytocola sp.]|uniref:hypothetical protein n=1 Tax=Actinophytocola sp. TaxID=1872138 RepID=UPI002DDDB7AD|nr:hypothetical protein [Actinophytocola sp.]HEV2778252.1 hypothetical protein [Actinophytocola sp.]